MFILPPPPKSSAFYPVGTLGGYYREGGPPPALEATNTSTSFEPNDDVKLTAPEGTYTPKEVVFVATPLPHPSDPPPAVVNPLAPTHTQPWSQSSGIRLSSAILQARYDAGSVAGGGSVGGGNLGLGAGGGAFGGRKSSTGKSLTGWFQKKVAEDDSLTDPAVDSTSSIGSAGIGPDVALSSSAPVNSSLTSFGHPLGRRDTTASAMAILTPVVSSGASNVPKKKPKNSLAKNNSSFVSRTVTHESLNKRLAERSGSDLFIWLNVGRSISWLDLSPSAAGSHHEPLVKVLFTKAHPLSHDVNHLTKTAQNLDVVVGMSSGDIIWIEYLSSRYNRINKNGDVTRSAVTEIRWIPGSESLFLTGHADGSLAVFDKEREDGGGFASQERGANARSTAAFKILRSQFDTDIVTTKDNRKTNPVAVYKISNSPITGLKFSPTSNILAVTSKDGYLRLLNLATEEVSEIFPSYYGGFLSVAFSPDGKYLATGGQDDMLCIWRIDTSPRSGGNHLVARGQGHSSWVRQVAFDPWCSDDTNYRIGTVGDDGKVLLWDFNPKSLPRKHHPTRSDGRRDQQESTLGNAVLHPFVSQSDTPVIPPVVKKTVLRKSDVESEPLSDLIFTATELVVVARDGRVYNWARPT